MYIYIYIYIYATPRASASAAVLCLVLVSFAKLTRFKKKTRTPRLKKSVVCDPLSETPGDTYEGTLATV